MVLLAAALSDNRSISRYSLFGSLANPAQVEGRFGVLIVDDYGHWRGARRAVDEYLAKNSITNVLASHRLHRPDWDQDLKPRGRNEVRDGNHDGKLSNYFRNSALHLAMCWASWSG